MIADVLDRKTSLRLIEDALSESNRVVFERGAKLDGPEQEPLDMLREQIEGLLQSIN
jgi:hypothetical protein